MASKFYIQSACYPAICTFLFLHRIAASTALASTVLAPAAGVAPRGNGDLIASLYARLANARTANRMDAVNRYERMIDCLEKKEEEEMEARLNAPA